MSHNAFLKLDTKGILNNFKKIVEAGKKSNKVTHIIEYIFTQNDLESSTYQDIYKIFTANVGNDTKCIFDIMMVTKSESSFIHVRKDKYEIQRFDVKAFFKDSTFKEFIKNVKKTQNEYKNNINSIFVFGGHCDGWYCYCENFVVNFNMIRKTFIDNKFHFDLICFDSCYTSSLEIIYQFYDLTNYMMTHQTYVNYEGFNTHNISKIFSADIPFKQKLFIASLDFFIRSKEEKEHGSVTLVDCKLFAKFLKLYKKHFDDIRNVIVGKDVKKFITDPCGEWLSYCKVAYGPKHPTCDNTYCGNMLDLWNVLKTYGNQKIIKCYEDAVLFKSNGIPVNPKYFKHKIKFGGINVIIDPEKADNSVHYRKLKFYHDYAKHASV